MEEADACVDLVEFGMMSWSEPDARDVEKAKRKEEKKKAKKAAKEEKKRAKEHPKAEPEVPAEEKQVESNVDVPTEVQPAEEAEENEKDIEGLLKSKEEGIQLEEVKLDESCFSHLDEDRYSMCHGRLGLAIIINNRDFEPCTNMSVRNGTDVDAANLYQLFKTMGFETHMFHNQTCTNMLKIMVEAGSQSHSECSCLMMALLTHGDEGIVYGTDGIIRIETLTECFKGNICPTLSGKPKVFLIQCCLGTRLDAGCEVSDAEGEEREPSKFSRIPIEADFLMAYSTVPGYYSWRNSTKGSWFIQAFCQVMAEKWKTTDLMTIMTRVNRLVAYEFESNAAREEMTNKKQVPCIMSMLTKQLFFRPREFLI